MIANMTAYVLARRWRPAPIYEALLEQDGIHLRDRTVLDSLESMKLDALIQREQGHVRFGPTARAAEMLQLSGASVGQHLFPVVDGDGRLLGVITSDEIAILRNEPALELVVNASDLMRPP